MESLIMANKDMSLVDGGKGKAGNFQLTYRREHPGNRCSYGIAGVPGIVVFDRGLFADPAFNGPITLDVALAEPKANPDKEAKAIEAAAKAKERADKAEERRKAAETRAAERAQKAQDRLAAAQAKVQAAQGKTETVAASDAPKA